MTDAAKVASTHNDATQVVDWSNPIEAVHADGRVRALKMLHRYAGVWGRNDHWCCTEDGQRFSESPGSIASMWVRRDGILVEHPDWRVRNRIAPAQRTAPVLDLKHIAAEMVVDLSAAQALRCSHVEYHRGYQAALQDVLLALGKKDVLLALGKKEDSDSVVMAKESLECDDMPCLTTIPQISGRFARTVD